MTASEKVAKGPVSSLLGLTGSAPDRATIIIRRNTSSSEVNISVISQADGKIRVEFSSKGFKGQDPHLNNQFTHFYNRRMGRQERRTKRGFCGLQALWIQLQFYSGTS
jgi:hypothetical protein